MRGEGLYGACSRASAVGLLGSWMGTGMVLLWTTVGIAVEESEPKVRLVSKAKGARVSLASVGSYYWARGVAVNQTDGPVRARALTATAPENLQVADGSPKVISGQIKSLLTS